MSYEVDDSSKTDNSDGEEFSCVECYAVFLGK
jgi:hypothetical protein